MSFVGDEKGEKLLFEAQRGINEYLENALANDRIDSQLYKDAKAYTLSYLDQWLKNQRIDEVSPALKQGITDAIREKRWEELVNAFRKKMNFGTGGIRGLMANHRDSIIALKEKGIDARILKGPNTLNNIVLLITSAGVAKFGLERGYQKIVIGFDSRIRGWDFAEIIAELFLAYGYTVFLFDSPCPYPEVTFAVPHGGIKADMGILISASHNDYRYNGYKLSCANGSQFDPEERMELYERFIDKSSPEDIKLLPLKDALKGKLVFLGGNEEIDGFEYYGQELMDIHKEHRDHIKSLLLFGEESDTSVAIISFLLKRGFCSSLVIFNSILELTSFYCKISFIF